MPFLLLSVFLHGMLLFGIRVHHLNSVVPTSRALSVSLQVEPIRTASSLPKPLSNSGKVGAKPLSNVATLPSNKDLLRESLALAGRYAYEDSQIAGRQPKIPVAWVGTYQGTYSGGNPTLEKVGIGRDYGKIRLTITESGEITKCVILSNALGKIACSGAIDASGKLEFLAPESDLFDAKFAGMVQMDASGSHFSGTWTAMHFPTGQPFNGEFRSTKTAIQALADM